MWCGPHIRVRRSPHTRSGRSPETGFRGWPSQGSCRIPLLRASLPYLCFPALLPVFLLLPVPFFPPAPPFATQDQVFLPQCIFSQHGVPAPDRTVLKYNHRSPSRMLSRHTGNRRWQRRSSPRETVFLPWLPASSPPCPRGPYPQRSDQTNPPH